MHFMILILLFLLCVVVWGFFHSNPAGVSPAGLWGYNVALLVVAVLAGVVIGQVLYADAVVVKADEKGMAAYLAIMAGGTVFMIVVAAGGLVRNLALFPQSKRRPAQNAQ